MFVVAKIKTPLLFAVNTGVITIVMVKAEVNYAIITITHQTAILLFHLPENYLLGTMGTLQWNVSRTHLWWSVWEIEQHRFLSRTIIINSIRS